MIYQLFISWIMSLVVYLKRDHYISLSLRIEELYPSSSRFSSMLFSKNFIVLCFTFKFTIHLELIFVKGERTVSRFFFCFFGMYMPSNSSIICAKGYLCSIAFPFLLCQRSVDYICMGLFLGSLLSSVIFFYQPFFYQYQPFLVALAL